MAEKIQEYFVLEFSDQFKAVENSGVIQDFVTSPNLGVQGQGDSRCVMGISDLASGVYFATLYTDEGMGMAARASFKLAVVK